jgi:hypothetical protein
MSHIVQIKTEVRDENAIAAACQRLGLAPPVTGEFQVYAVKRTGIGVQLPGWNYPIVCNTETGAVDFDNYNGSWGDQQHLDKFLQAYAVEKARYEAQKGGYSVWEEAMEDGSIKLNITVEE